MLLSKAMLMYQRAKQRSIYWLHAGKQKNANLKYQSPIINKMKNKFGTPPATVELT